MSSSDWFQSLHIYPLYAYWTKSVENNWLKRVLGEVRFEHVTPVGQLVVFGGKIRTVIAAEWPHAACVKLERRVSISLSQWPVLRKIREFFLDLENHSLLLHFTVREHGPNAIELTTLWPEHVLRAERIPKEQSASLQLAPVHFLQLWRALYGLCLEGQDSAEGTPFSLVQHEDITLKALDEQVCVSSARCRICKSRQVLVETHVRKRCYSCGSRTVDASYDAMAMWRHQTSRGQEPLPPWNEAYDLIIRVKQLAELASRVPIAQNISELLLVASGLLENSSGDHSVVQRSLKSLSELAQGGLGPIAIEELKEGLKGTRYPSMVDWENTSLWSSRLCGSASASLRSLQSALELVQDLEATAKEGLVSASDLVRVGGVFLPRVSLMIGQTLGWELLMKSLLGVQTQLGDGLSEAFLVALAEALTKARSEALRGFRELEVALGAGDPEHDVAAWLAEGRTVGTLRKCIARLREAQQLQP